MMISFELIPLTYNITAILGYLLAGVVSITIIFLLTGLGLWLRDKSLEKKHWSKFGHPYHDYKEGKK